MLMDGPYVGDDQGGRVGPKSGLPTLADIPIADGPMRVKGGV